jgi:hypothetical protein
MALPKTTSEDYKLLTIARFVIAGFHDTGHEKVVEFNSWKQRTSK